MKPITRAIIVHGGAGAVTADRHARLLEGVRRAAAVGDAILARGGSALDAVVASVRVLEDDPEYNAGTGSALTRDGTVETDASVMDGLTQRVGAVAAVPDLGNAVALARAVMEAGEHVMLAGAAAWEFAREVGIVPAPAGSLVTERARKRLAATLAARGSGGSSNSGGGGSNAGGSNGGGSNGGGSDGGGSSGNGGGSNGGGSNSSGGSSGSGGGSNGGGSNGGGSNGGGSNGGTVGAVARDRDGRFAAATSTGGISGKRAGRVGDSPIVGAGTWADRECALSATGDGEAIVRVALTRSIALRIAAGIPFRRAIDDGLRELVAITAGSAGVIGVCHYGVIGLQLSETMPSASIVDGVAADSMGVPLVL